MANALDLTKNCALCGGALTPSVSVEDLPGYVWHKGELDVLHTSPCPCTSRSNRGKCGRCDACFVEQNGCACDGAYDIGCFICRPGHFERPPCPHPNLNQSLVV